MSNIDTMNSKSNLNCISDELFTELTPEAAEVIQGGEAIRLDAINQSQTLTTGNFENTFLVDPGGDITLSTINTKSSLGYKKFSATILNVGTNASNTKTVDIGVNQTTTWTNVNGGEYKLILQDPDEDTITGDAFFTYT